MIRIAGHIGRIGENGGFVLNFSADGKSFTGTWGTGTSRSNGGPWVGTRK